MDTKNFPSLPGVYLMKDKKGKVLYVGKANNLKSRVKQYFAKTSDDRAMIPFLIEKVESIDTIVVRSEKEALILENNLIKEHKPRYNALLKDDKTYIALKINVDSEWPMVKIVRYRGRPKNDGLYFGPYTSAFAARETLDLLRKVFPLRQCTDQEFARRNRPCILYDMKRCMAPCVGLCTKEQYQVEVKRMIQFLEGKDDKVIDRLRLEMERASEALEFEKAGEIYQKIRSIEKTVEEQHVDKIFGSDFDAIGLYRLGGEAAIAKMFYRSGKLMGSKTFYFSDSAEEDGELLASFLMQHYTMDEELPKTIFLSISIPSLVSYEEVLGTKIQVPRKGDKKKLIDLASENAKVSLDREKDEAAILEKTLVSMQEKLHLTRLPEIIDCIDNSNLSQSEPVSAVISFSMGKPDKKRYRTYKIKAAKAGDDYGSMLEVLTRRFEKLKEENALPDLLVVDGGRGQLNVALRVFKNLNIISVDIVSLAKEQGRHDKGQTEERVFLPEKKDPVILPKNSPILFLLQRIRDEAHRFVIGFQKKRRSKVSISSELESIPGIGKVKKRSLISHLGSLKRVREASIEELRGVPKISASDAKLIREYFDQKEKG